MWRQAGSRELNGLMIRFAEDILQVGSEIYVSLVEGAGPAESAAECAAAGWLSLQRG